MINFFVPGIPVPKGSGRAIIHRHTKKAMYLPDNEKTKDWQMDVRIIALRHKPSEVTRSKAVRVHLTFYVPRPASVSYKKRRYPIVKPDIDKLSRTILDALNGVAYVDDSQVVCLHTRKFYGDNPGVVVAVRLFD